MTFPSDPTVMLLLLAIHTGQRLDVTDGTLTLEVPGVAEPVALANLDDSLTALESRQWITIGEAGPVVTEQGHYALTRYLKKYGVHPERFTLSMRAVKV